MAGIRKRRRNDCKQDISRYQNCCENKQQYRNVCDRHGGSIITANNFPLLQLGYPADASPALLGHLREVLQAHNVNGHILSFLFGGLLARGVGRVDIGLALDLLLVTALGVHAQREGEETQHEQPREHSHLQIYYIKYQSWSISLAVVEDRVESQMCIFRGSLARRDLGLSNNCKGMIIKTSKAMIIKGIAWVKRIVQCVPGESGLELGRGKADSEAQAMVKERS